MGGLPALDSTGPARAGKSPMAPGVAVPQETRPLGHRFVSRDIKFVHN